MATYYETLEITRFATESEIKDSYRRLAMIHHPDRNNGSKASETKFKRIQEAYETLSDLNKKNLYDLSLTYKKTKPKTTTKKYTYTNPENFNSQYRKPFTQKEQDDFQKSMNESRKSMDEALERMKKDREEALKNLQKSLDELKANTEQLKKTSSSKKTTSVKSKQSTPDWLKEINDAKESRIKEKKKLKEQEEFEKAKVEELIKKAKKDKPVFNLSKKVKILLTIAFVLILSFIVSGLIISSIDDGSYNPTLVKQNEK